MYPQVFEFSYLHIAHVYIMIYQAHSWASLSYKSGQGPRGGGKGEATEQSNSSSSGGRGDLGEGGTRGEEDQHHGERAAPPPGGGGDRGSGRSEHRMATGKEGDVEGTERGETWTQATVETRNHIIDWKDC